MEQVYLAKGARASAAIEGNSLNEAQAVAAVEGTLKVSQSQEYLQQELENVINALATVEREVHTGGTFNLTPQRLHEINAETLKGLEVEDHVVPGEFRTGGIIVGNVYQGAPAGDCGFLIDTLCSWLNGPDFQTEGDDHAAHFLHAFLRAVIAHVYIAWIHPFGDGNGRTARLVEFGILTTAGIPSVAAHLLSNHYNATRARYYRQLDLASKSGGDLVPFLGYAAGGFAGELQQQLNEVHEQIVNATWVNYVHTLFPDPTLTERRRRDLVLALSHQDFVSRANLTTLTPRLTDAYAGKGRKTVTRDLNDLADRDLIERTPKGVRARREVILSFLPRAAPGGENDIHALFPANR
jgi:Fic family protein